MRTEKKNMGMGILRIGEVTFRNQLGVIGKNLRKSRKKNKLLLFSSAHAHLKETVLQGFFSKEHGSIQTLLLLRAQKWFFYCYMLDIVETAEPCLVL